MLLESLTHGMPTMYGGVRFNVSYPRTLNRSPTGYLREDLATKECHPAHSILAIVIDGLSVRLFEMDYCIRSSAFQTVMLGYTLWMSLKGRLSPKVIYSNACMDETRYLSLVNSRLRFGRCVTTHFFGLCK